MADTGWQEYARELARKLQEEDSLPAEWVRDALLRVPRHLFIEQYYERFESDSPVVRVDPRSPTNEQLKAIYTDDALMIRQPPTHSASSQPLIMFLMLHDLGLDPGMKVLEIGAGTGWNAGLLALGAGDDRLVYSMDIQADLVEEAAKHLRAAGFAGVNLRAGDGGYGWPEAAPFDRIIVTAGACDIPPRWTEQLAEGGVLVLPFNVGGIGFPVLRLVKRDGRVAGRFTRWSGFYPMRGDFGSVPASGQEPGPSSEVDSLMQGDGTPIVLHQPVEQGLLFFLYLNGIRQTAFIYREGIGSGFVFLDREAGSLCFIPHGDSPMRVYGSPEMGERLARMQDEWLALGQPKMTDYELDYLGPAICELKANEWLDERPCARLKVSRRAES